jgi:hypothetical protein
MNRQPASLKEYIEAIREALVCERCGRYVGSLALDRYVPPPYPLAIGRMSDDEVEVLAGFEWQMVERLRRGNFTIRHPERDGRCISVREWLRDDEDEDNGVDGG